MPFVNLLRNVHMLIEHYDPKFNEKYFFPAMLLLKLEVTQYIFAQSNLKYALNKCKFTF